jgi:hypothetical protein
MNSRLQYDYQFSFDYKESKDYWRQGKSFKYLQMIRDENKRMHAQVENVLWISKLEKRELDIEKRK